VGTFPFGKSVMAGDDQKWAPETRESADHSLPYLVAVALVRGDVRVADFTPEALADSAVKAVLDVLTVEVDDECAAAWPAEARSAVSVTFEDGSTEQETVRDYSGHSRNPMPDEAVNAKFLAGAGQVLPDGDAAVLLERLWNIDQLDDAAEVLALSITAGA
jgi:2-methylcitrate dehydratase